MGRKAEFTESLDIVGDRDSFFAGRNERDVNRFRQPPLSALLCDGDRFEPFVGHGYSGLSLHSLAGACAGGLTVSVSGTGSRTGRPCEWSTRGRGVWRSRDNAGAP